MADAVTSQILADNGSTLVVKYTNISDGTGESAVLKADVSAFTSAPAEVAIEGMIAHTDGMGVNILWDADTDVLAFAVGQNCNEGYIDFTHGGMSPGLINNSGAGKTGDIRFTTRNHTSGDAYSIILFLRRRA